MQETYDPPRQLIMPDSPDARVKRLEALFDELLRAIATAKNITDLRARAGEMASRRDGTKT